MRKHPLNGNPNLLSVNESTFSNKAFIEMKNKEKPFCELAQRTDAYVTSEQKGFDAVIRSIKALFYGDFFDKNFVPSNQISMFTAAIGTGLAILDGRVLFFAVLAVGDRLDRFDFQSATAQKIRAVCIPVPTINELIVHNRGYFADLHDDFLDFGRLVFDGDVAHDVRDVKHYT